MLAAAGCFEGDSLSDGDKTEKLPADEPAPDGQVRQFTVHAIEADVVYNAFDLHQPKAAVYVLEENLVEALAASGVTPDDAFADLPDDARDKKRDRFDNDHGGDLSKKEKKKLEKKLETADREIEEAKKRKEKAKNDKERKKARKALHRARKKKAKAKRKLGDVDTTVLQPLTIRANVGDVFEIEFVNHLDRHASMHQTALPYHVTESDGASVGDNPDTTAAPGETVSYEWYATHEGTHFFHDLANPAFDSADEPPEEANLVSRGLFGSAVVEPPEATWTHPETGEEHRSGVRADVHMPGDDEPSHREFIIHYHTPEGVYPADGRELTWPGSDEPQTVHAINYRADPTGIRLGEEGLELVDDSDPDPEELAEYFYNSWIFGDPGGGDNVYRTYVGDPVKLVAVGASHEERHSHHLHGHRWKEVPGREDVDTIDVQNFGFGATHETKLVAAHGGVGFFDMRPIGFGPGEVPKRLEGGLNLTDDELDLNGDDDDYEGLVDPLTTVRPEMEWDEAFDVGAGGPDGNTGDYLMHCHLFPHYGEGMWASMRVYDKVQEDLELLEDNAPPLDADDETPGYPDFIPGEQGEAPPKPPYEFVRDPTPEEAAALGDVVPGAPYTDPRDPGIPPEEYGGPPAGEDAPIREYDIVALPAELVYNDAGDHDPDGQVFVLEEDVADVLTGKMNPEPLVIRANVGDCIEITLTNLMPEGRSNHIHFVSYDVLGSDSLANGFNYDQAAEPGGQMTYRWYADEEGTILFHDHIDGIDELLHGHFATLIVEPEGSEWYDPHTGDPIEAGTQAIVSPPDDEDFREFALLYHDFAPLRNRQGQFVNEREEHNRNAGVMAINYRNAPYYRRGPDPDPAYVHSSYVNGDPPTPVLEAYDGDPVRIRLVQPAYEEQHNFFVDGAKISLLGASPEAQASQAIHVAEAFTLFLDSEADELSNPDGLPVYDHLYGSGISDDLWDGMWGIHRVFGAKVDHLQPLPDRGAPKGEITEDQLREMGHPAPFLDWETLGRKAWLTYSEDIRRKYDLGKHALDEQWQRDLVEAFEKTNREGLLSKLLRGDFTLEDILAALGLTRKELKHETDIDPKQLKKRLEEFDGIERVDKPPFPSDEPARQNPNVGEIPPQPPDPGKPCPDDAIVREYDVTVFQTDITFNEYGDHDPNGIVFALDEHVEDIRAGERPPEPLTLRANEGDCIQINLTNELPVEFAPDHAHPEMRTREQDLNVEWEESNRTSLSPQRLEMDVQASEGVTVGFTFDQTIPPGETITYRWFANEQLGTSILWDMADVRGHRHHGAFGHLHVEPEGSIWLDPATAEPLADHGDRFAPSMTTESIIVPDDGPAFREFPLSFSDGRYIVNRDEPDDCVVPPGPDDDADAPCNQIPDDPEDQGYMAINNRAEPFIRRFQAGPDDQHLVFDSEVHGDPATPVMNAFVEDPVRFRVSHSADKARGFDFHLAAHQWLRHQNVPESEIVGVDDQFMPGRSRQIDPLAGAGGLVDSVGDHLFMETKLRRRLEAGAWGIFRVGEDDDDFRRPIQPLPDRIEKKKLKPEARTGWTVSRGDATGNGTTDVLIGVPGSRIAGDDAGAAYLFHGPVDESVLTDLSDADVQFLGTPGKRIGSDVSIKKNEIRLSATDGKRQYVFDGTTKLPPCVEVANADDVR